MIATFLFHPVTVISAIKMKRLNLLHSETFESVTKLLCMSIYFFRDNCRFAYVINKVLCFYQNRNKTYVGISSRNHGSSLVDPSNLHRIDTEIGHLNHCHSGFYMLDLIASHKKKLTTKKQWRSLGGQLPPVKYLAPPLSPNFE